MGGAGQGREANFGIRIVLEIFFSDKLMQPRSFFLASFFNYSWPRTLSGTSEKLLSFDKIG